MGENLGSCQNFEFLPCEELETAVNKVEGKDTLSVTNITLQFKDKDDFTQTLRLQGNSLALICLKVFYKVCLFQLHHWRPGQSCKEKLRGRNQ